MATASLATDYAGNPSAPVGPLREADPVCDCLSGQFVTEPCTERTDAVCAPCTGSCESGFYIVSACGGFQDIACRACRSCQTPFFANGGCAGGQDRICSECTVCGIMEYEATPCTAGVDRTCISCERSSECVDPTPQCENAAKWWKQANCCYDDDGVQLPCNEMLEANVRISKRNSREHWVYDTIPAVEAGFELGDASTA